MPEQNSSAVVQAVGLTKIFRDFWGRPRAKAVNDIDFEVREGEVVGLLGPNGSGKSTTVKMLLGLLYPSAGSLKVFGKSPRAVDSKKLIGYLPEETYLYKYLTAEETLDFFGSLFNLPAEERRRRTAQLLEMVGLSHAARRRVGEFSKGMARRIGLAQAMINDPAFLLLDEPTSGLDPLGCREVKDLILNLKKRGKTVLMTSHLLSDVEDVCDRVIILYGGKIRSEGALSDLLKDSARTEMLSPQLTPQTEEEITRIIRQESASGEILFSNPRRTLEEYFLDVVNQAREESAATSGAAQGGKLADYLAEPGRREEELLASLAGQNKTAEEAGKEDMPDTRKAEESAEKSEEEAGEILQNLAAGEENLSTEKPEEPENKEQQSEALSAGDLSEADRRLSGMFTTEK